MKRLSPDDHVKRVAGFVFGIILASCGSVIVVMSLKTQMKANQSIHWTQVQGKIISDTMHQGDGAEFRMIHYQYSVGDKAFEGDRLCFGVDSAAMDRIAATGQNTQVTVFVNPAMPQESVLVPGIFGGATAFFVAGAVLIALGIITSCVISCGYDIFNPDDTPKGRKGYGAFDFR